MESGNMFRAIGLDFAKLPLEMRGRIRLSEQDVTQLLHSSAGQDRNLDTVVVSTCTRTDVYLHGPANTVDSWSEQLQQKLSLSSIDPLSCRAFCLTGYQAVEHLLSVASGHQSAVFGTLRGDLDLEDGIEKAIDSGSLSGSLQTILKRAASFGRKVQLSTPVNIGESIVGVVNMCCWEMLVGRVRRMLVLGAGRAARHFMDNRERLAIDDLCVTNRSYNKAEQLAAEYGGSAIPWSSRNVDLAEFDLIIAATSSEKPVLSQGDLAKLGWKKGGPRPLIVDFGVPRNIEIGPSAGVLDLDGILKLIGVNVPLMGSSAVSQVRQIGDEVRVWREDGVLEADLDSQVELV